MSYYHIMIATPNGEEKRGKASSIDELFTLLNNKEKKEIFAKDAFKGLQDLFKNKDKNSQESYIEDINGLSINFISDGYQITTLVFYF